MAIKTIIPETHPKNRIIKALLKKNYTGVVLTWHSAMERSRGFVLMCDQIEYKRLGACVESSLECVENLPDLNRDNNG